MSANYIVWSPRGQVCVVAGLNIPSSAGGLTFNGMALSIGQIRWEICYLKLTSHRRTDVCWCARCWCLVSEWAWRRIKRRVGPDWPLCRIRHSHTVPQGKEYANYDITALVCGYCFFLKSKSTLIISWSIFGVGYWYHAIQEDTGYVVWSPIGGEVQRVMLPRVFLFKWRPRPQSLLKPENYEVCLYLWMISLYANSIITTEHQEEQEGLPGQVRRSGQSLPQPSMYWNARWISFSIITQLSSNTICYDAIDSSLAYNYTGLCRGDCWAPRSLRRLQCVPINKDRSHQQKQGQAS